MKKELEEAAKLLRAHGFSVLPAKYDPSLLYIIRIPLHNGRYNYLVRMQKTGRFGTFRSEQETEIAEVKLSNLKWEKEK